MLKEITKNETKCMCDMMTSCNNVVLADIIRKGALATIESLNDIADFMMIQNQINASEHIDAQIELYYQLVETADKVMEIE